MSTSPEIIAERAALTATLLEANPQAPTLCVGWRVVDLLAHLVLREHRPDLMVRDGLSGAEPGGEPHLQRLVADALDADGYADLVARFAAGPPRLSPMRALDAQVNLLEYVIHQEDIRRGPRGADGESGPAEPRDDVSPALSVAVWKQVAGTAGLRFRGAGCGVVLVVPGGPRKVVRRGRESVALHGDPIELALYSAGRRRAAEVGIQGRPDVVDRFLRGIGEAPEPGARPASRPAAV
ncbi:MAG: TIGR03085 family metal-binding protein [Actinomycetaceae bacterium]